ncbi:carboxypeptidase-like regulatory domain-containing protein [Lujinxingia litoralis]|nr:carboxypeptidase-like regulatory domain-containing protein [Lujinxingia litoralis]
MTPVHAMKWWVLCLVVVGGLVAGCAEDVVEEGVGPCAEGLRYNPVTGLCLAAGDEGPGEHDDAGQPSDTGGRPDGGDQPDGSEPEDVGSSPDGGSTPDADASVEPPEDCGPGHVIARVCATNGQVLAAANATISGVDCEGQPFEMSTRTDSSGTFEFDAVPAGSHSIVVSSGSFSRTSAVTVYEGETTDLTADADKLCVDGSSVRIAVLQGQYDNVREILGELNLSYELMGRDASTLGGAGVERAQHFLENAAQLNYFRILFIECGTLWYDLQSRGANMGLIAQNLRQFVANGNSIYASDWAHPFISEVFEGMIEFEGTTFDGARVGFAPQQLNATVESSEMQTLLSDTSASIRFGESDIAWVVARSAGPGSVVHFSADVTKCAGSQCTNPPSAGAVVEDSPLLVSRREQPNYGTVVFTSFHNKAQSDLGEDMQRILEFLIFRL